MNISDFYIACILSTQWKQQRMYTEAICLLIGSMHYPWLLLGSIVCFIKVPALAGRKAYQCPG